MKFLLAVLFVFFTFPIFAANGSNVQILQGNSGLTITPEFFWRHDESGCGGLSFVDLYEDDRWFTNNVIDCAVGDIFVGAELSANNSGETVKLGIGKSFPVPGMKVFRVTAYPGVWSDFGDQPQVKLVWLTEDWQLSESISVYSTGFYRLRRSIPDAYQPQVWLKKKGWKTHVGIEVFGVGGERNVQVAIKYVF